MGLTTSYTTKDNVTSASAYAKIKDIKIRPHDNYAMIIVDIYKDKATADDGSFDPLDTCVCQISGTDYTTYLQDSVIRADGKSLEGQAYAAIKADDFSSWSDVFESGQPKKS